jgi:hypothetical protein
MKKLVFLFLLTALSIVGMAQSRLMFWTANKDYGNIKIYVNNRYEGTITHAYRSAPDCGAYGCVTVVIRGQHNTWHAEGEDGSRWSSERASLRKGCNRLRLYGSANYHAPQATSSSSGNASGSSSGSPSGNVFTDTDDETAMAMAYGMVFVAALAAPVGLLFAATDIYGHWATSQNYTGYTFGLKNAISLHTDFELGGGIYQPKADYKTPSGFFKTDYPHDRRPSTWAIDLNILHNILPRRMAVNPYLGIATSGLITADGGYGIGGMAGISAGLWRNRIQLHARYKWVKNFAAENVLANQLEFGMSIRYKYGWSFRRQEYEDPEPVEGVHMGFYGGFSTNTAAGAKWDDRRINTESGTGGDFGMYISAGQPWAFNMSFGFKSRGWKISPEQDSHYLPSPSGTKDNFYYMTMLMGASYQLNIVEDRLALLPYAGLFFDILLSGGNFKGDDEESNLNMCNIGPAGGVALRINNAFDIGVQCDYGLVNVFKQGDDKTYDGAKFRHSGMQFFTRILLF